MGKIVFFEVEEWEKSFLTTALPDQDVVFSEYPLDAQHTFDPSIFDAEVVSPFIYSQLTAEQIAKFPKLRCIVTRSTGYDHIAVDYCKQKGILVCNVPSYGIHGVAEHAFSLILALAKKIIPSVERTQKADFTTEGLTGFELFGKTLGVIGAGKIGKSVIQIANGFGMNIQIYSRHTDPDLETLGARFVDLDTLLSSSDIISLHVPLTDETKHMINIENLHKFKKGTYLINTARGGLIETEAILKGLETGIFAGVGLDVLEEECDIKEERELLSKQFTKVCDLKTQLMNHMLLNRDDVIVTPHNAFNSKESLEEILQTTVKNIQSFLSNEPINIINK